MLQLILILVAPVFISATVYITLGKLKQVVLSRPKRKCSPTTLFVVADVIAFCSQIGGSLVQITGDRNIMKIGDSVVLGGLVFQETVLLVFLYLVLRFRKTALRETYPGSWKLYVWLLLGSVVAIWIRNLVRAIEFGQGFYGFISQHEAVIYIFDSFPMFSVVSAFAGLHTGRFMKKQRKSHDSIEVELLSVR